jgi:hypothetical protein
VACIKGVLGCSSVSVVADFLCVNDCSSQEARKAVRYVCGRLLQGSVLSARLLGLVFVAHVASAEMIPPEEAHVPVRCVS